MKLRPDALRWRLTLWYSCVFALLLAVLAGGSRALVGETLTVRADEFLSEALQSFTAELRVERDVRASTLSSARVAMRDLRFRDITFLVYAEHGRLIAASDDSATSSRMPVRRDLPRGFDRDSIPRLVNRAQAGAVTANVSGLTGYHRAIADLVTVRGERLIVAAVQSRTALRQTLSRLTLAYVVAIPLFLVVAALTGYALSGRTLAPIAKMSRQARAISASTLHERLPVANPRDELGELATVVNELLRRLETSFEQQRRFVANASHELRTPVAIVRAESEVALAREGRSETEYRETLRVVHDAADRLSRIVHDLFLLARADAGPLPIRKEPLYLEDMVADVVRSMRAVAGESDVRIEVASTTEAPFVGDTELLGRMLLNLVDNAVKFSPADATVEVGLSRYDHSYKLSVADHGPGIPPEARSHVFERFYRVDKARGHSERSVTSGAGLGLAIVQLVAEAHGGRAELARTSESGSEFVVTLPAQSTIGS